MHGNPRATGNDGRSKLVIRCSSSVRMRVRWRGASVLLSLKESTVVAAPAKPAGADAGSVALFGRRTDIKALTALRLLPAIAVIFYHGQDYFDCLQGKGTSLAFTHALSYFFVLSGFVLTINYFNISSITSAVRFYIARFARIWPAHFICLCLLVVLVPEVFKVKGTWLPVFFANASMLQSWIPSWRYYFSYNAPSWSNSTEIFFYLTFPLLVWAMRKHWYIPLSVAGFTLASLICVCNYLQLPEFDRLALSVQSLVYINPLSRLLEFTVGMTAALVFYRFLSRVPLSTVTATMLELSSLALVFFLMANAMTWRQACLPVVGNPASMWLLNSGIPVLSTAALILIVALEKGLISKFLSVRPLVLLGELSFGMYMLHCVLLAYRSVSFPQDRSIVALALFITTLLVAAHFMWFAVERPIRRLIVAIGDYVFGLKKGSSAAGSVFERLGAELAENLRPGKHTVWALLEAAALAALLYFSLPALHTVRAEEARTVIAGTNSSVRDVIYEPYLSCTSAGATPSSSGARVELLWQALRDQSLDFSVVARALDKQGRGVGQLTYKQNPRGGTVAKGTTWIERFEIPVKTGTSVSQVAVTVRKGKRQPVLPSDHAAVNGPERQLLIPVTGGRPLLVGEENTRLKPAVPLVQREQRLVSQPVPY